MQITQKDNYFYEGADLGILVLRGRLMSEDFQLSDRGKRWIKVLREHYRADIIDPGTLDINELYAADGFKMM